MHLDRKIHFYNIESHHMLTSCYEIDLQMIDIKYNVKIEHLIELDLYIYIYGIKSLHQSKICNSKLKKIEYIH